MDPPVPRISVGACTAHERQAQTAEWRDHIDGQVLLCLRRDERVRPREDVSGERTGLAASGTAASSTSITELRPNDPPMVNPLADNRVRRAGPHLLGSWDLRLKHGCNAEPESNSDSFLRQLRHSAWLLHNGCRARAGRKHAGGHLQQRPPRMVPRAPCLITLKAASAALTSAFWGVPWRRPDPPRGDVAERAPG